MSAEDAAFWRRSLSTVCDGEMLRDAKPLVAGMARGYASVAAFEEAWREMIALGGEENEDEANWIGNGGVAGQRGDVCGAGCGTGRTGSVSSDHDGEKSTDAI